MISGVFKYARVPFHHSLLNKFSNFNNKIPNFGSEGQYNSSLSFSLCLLFNSSSIGYNFFSQTSIFWTFHNKVKFIFNFL